MGFRVGLGLGLRVGREAKGSGASGLGCCFLVLGLCEGCI